MGFGKQIIGTIFVIGSTLIFGVIGFIVSIIICMIDSSTNKHKEKMKELSEIKELMSKKVKNNDIK